MKRLLIALAMVVGATACSGDKPADPLTSAEYAAQGNAICERMNADLDALSIKVAAGVNPQQERDILTEAQEISATAIDAIVDLVPPASLAGDRQSLVMLLDARRDLIERLLNGENVDDELAAVDQQFDDEATALWPSCTT